MPLLIACSKCGIGMPRDAKVCSQCGTLRRRLLPTSERGYGRAHQRRRAALMPAAIGQLCPLCGELMREDDELDLHHIVPLVIAPNSSDVTIVHARCNRAHPARSTPQSAVADGARRLSCTVRARSDVARNPRRR